MDFELAPGRLIGPDHPVFIIAEIGQNHQGNLVKPIYRITYKSMYTHSCSSSISEPIPLLMNSFYLFRPLGSADPRNIYIRCGRVIRDFEREAKTRCNNADKLGGIDFTKISKLSMCSAGAGRCWLVLKARLPPRHCTWSVLKFL